MKVCFTSLIFLALLISSMTAWAGDNYYITRANNWSKNSGKEISSKEWLDYVKSDPELALLSAPKISAHNPYCALWVNHRNGKDFAWFNWSAGNIYTKNSDSATEQKLFKIADHLNAQIQGEDGRTVLLFVHNTPVIYYNADFEKYVGRPIGELLKDLEETYKTYTFWEEPPGMVGGCEFYFKNGRVLVINFVHSPNSMRLNKLRCLGRPNWNLKEFKKEIVSEAGWEEPK